MSNRNKRAGMVATRQPPNHTATYNDAQIFPNLSFIQYLAIQKQQMALDGLKGRQNYVQSEQEGGHGCDDTTFQPHSDLQRRPYLSKPLTHSISCNTKTTYGIGWAKRAAVQCPIRTTAKASSQRDNLPTTRQLGKTPISFQTLLAFNTCNAKTTHGAGWANRAAVPCPIGTRGLAWLRRDNLPSTQQLRTTPKSSQTSHLFNILQ